jgi:hypothetical protein
MHYISEKWRDILIFNGLDSHEKIWSLKADWFEEPNHRRGGWSGVSRIELKLPLGGKAGVFLKRQEDHMTRSIAHPVKGILTFSREFDMIQMFQQHTIPTLEVVAFDHWKEAGKRRGCIMTEELLGYIPLSSAEYGTDGKFIKDVDQKLHLFKKLAALMHAMHQRHFQHGCFYPKHVFAKQLPGGETDLRVIDLERVRQPFFKGHAVFRDLDTWLRHADNWSHADKLAFFKIYQGEDELSARSRRLWNKLNTKKQPRA